MNFITNKPSRFWGIISSSGERQNERWALDYNYFNFALSSFSAPGSRQLVFIAYYLVLSFLLMYSSSGLSTDVFPNETNINTYYRNSNHFVQGFNVLFVSISSSRSSVILSLKFPPLLQPFVFCTSSIKIIFLLFKFNFFVLISFQSYISGFLFLRYNFIRVS